MEPEVSFHRNCFTQELLYIRSVQVASRKKVQVKVKPRKE